MKIVFCMLQITDITEVQGVVVTFLQSNSEIPIYGRLKASEHVQ